MAEIRQPQPWKNVFLEAMLVNTAINCDDSLIIKIVFLKDNWICHVWGKKKKTSPRSNNCEEEEMF